MTLFTLWIEDADPVIILYVIGLAALVASIIWKEQVRRRPRIRRILEAGVALVIVGVVYSLYRTWAAPVV